MGNGVSDWFKGAGRMNVNIGNWLCHQDLWHSSGVQMLRNPYLLQWVEGLMPLQLVVL